jgi:hypothetical protein
MVYNFRQTQFFNFFNIIKMAKSQKNVVTHGLSGKVGDLLLFRQRGGKTIVSRIPEQPKTVSEKQKAQRQRFRRAVIYGQAAVVAPETKDLYETIAKKKGKTPFTLAVADWLNIPEILDIDCSDYSGQQGDVILVEAIDDAMVKYVRISIISIDGILVEEGLAVPDVSGKVWTYTATQTDNNDVKGYKIVVTVSDLPGNIVTETEEL